MPLVPGSVTVAADGTHTGSGLALAMYAAAIASPMMAAFLASDVPNDAKLALKRGDADLVTALATAIVGYLTANTVVNAGSLAAHVTTQQLGTLPDPPVAGAAIVAPASPTDVPLTGTGTIA